MLSNVLFMGSHPIVNSPSKETISIGLGLAEPYIIILIAILLVGGWLYWGRKKKY